MHDRSKRVALVWVGNPTRALDRYRSIRLDVLKPLIALPRVSWYAVQKVKRERESEHLANELDVHTLGPAIEDFTDTLAILQTLDLLITADTSVAHLAGAAGLPVWTLVPACADWRWLTDRTDRTDSPWYPSMRLFRQRQLGEWDPVVQELKGALREWQAAPRRFPQYPPTRFREYRVSAKTILPCAAGMPELDLNLIPYLVAMEETRNVSRAADRLGVSQPRVSTALGKLREYFGDQLFVRTSRGMEPTPRALALIPAAREALLRIEQGMLDAQDFEPSTTTHTFSIALSDVGEIVFLPRLLQMLAERAPRANLRSVSLPPSQIERGLESGDVDLAVGYFPDLSGNNFFQQRLFTHRFICLMRSDHPLAREPLTLSQFIGCGHAVVRAEGRSQEVLEQFLEKKRIRRRAVLETSHFMSLPFILARTDLIATVPHAIGFAYVSEHASITLVEPPLELPRFDLKQHWHRKFHNDPRAGWLRSVVAELFNDAMDEWPK